MLNNLLRDKAGGEKLLTFWWFLVLIVISLGIIAATTIYFSEDFDSRSYENSLLNKEIVDCLTTQQELTLENFALAKKDFLGFCKLDKEIFSSSGNFYFNISFLDSKGVKVIDDIVIGNLQFQDQCDLQKAGVKGKYFAVCSEEDNYVTYFQDDEFKEVKLKILVASNNEGEKVPFILE